MCLTRSEELGVGQEPYEDRFGVSKWGGGFGFLWNLCPRSRIEPTVIGVGVGGDR